tara:strand:- start:39 stop:497 length:459 start_codon:yes stop_codon:yes gene_type:complete
MARKIYSEDKMKELISRKGDGEEVPEGSLIFYYPDFIEKGGVTIENRGPERKVKTITKRVGGKPTPRRGADPGNIKSQENTNFEFKGSDLDYLRKKRKPSREQIETDRKERFRRKEARSLEKKISNKNFSHGGINIDYRKRQGGMFNRMGKK